MNERMDENLVYGSDSDEVNLNGLSYSYEPFTRFDAFNEPNQTKFITLLTRS